MLCADGPAKTLVELSWWQSTLDKQATRLPRFRRPRCPATNHRKPAPHLTHFSRRTEPGHSA
ncbi:hypothetical protein C3488_21990 [Streptomyces sp. Ru72]|nr:hypothetical protein C3488_21990 [Streptomyces sp. Ru72]